MNVLISTLHSYTYVTKLYHLVDLGLQILVSALQCQVLDFTRLKKTAIQLTIATVWITFMCFLNIAKLDNVEVLTT